MDFYQHSQALSCYITTKFLVFSLHIFEVGYNILSKLASLKPYKDLFFSCNPANYTHLS